MKRTFIFLLMLVVLVGAAGCASASPSPQPSGEYLEGALNWMQTHSVHSKNVDWSALRRDALALVADAKTPAETYPAIRLAINRLGDGNAFFMLPERAGFDAGFHADYPNGVVRWVKPGGPADKAGMQIGDVIETVNGAPLRALDGNPASFFLDVGSTAQLELTVRRRGLPEPLKVTMTQDPALFDLKGEPVLRRLGSDRAEVGYIELLMDSGGDAAAGRYTGAVHQFMRAADESPVCGWVVDLRRNFGGNLWTYLAAIGPLLGEGDLGGFVYADGKKEPWTYEDGKIKWNGAVRDESAVAGGVYRRGRANPPVVLLVDQHTIAAGELVAVAFQGRPNVILLGGPTGGVATLTDHTPLSDGAHLFVSGAYGMDKHGTVYDKPIQPEKIIATDWAKFGTVEDAALTEAYKTLASQPDCG